MNDDGILGDRGGARASEFPATSELDAEWAALLRYLQTVRGFDFHGYKVNTLMRRIRKRMAMLGVESFADYQDYLQVHSDEFATLFDTILINVTGFFRDPAAWEIIRTQVIPRILEARGPVAPLRVWSAGCATGEEAYTIAMLFVEALGPERFRERVKIYATDLDEAALVAARHAAYTPSQTGDVPPPLLKRYFEAREGLYVFRRELRRQVTFGRHDIIHDAPIARIDLLVCRNTLMYFNAETQARVLGRLHFALNDGGYLFLGRAETLMAYGLAFQPVDPKQRISRKVGGGRPPKPRQPPVSPAVTPPVPPTHAFHATPEASPFLQPVPDSLDVGVAVLDRDLRVLAWNARAAYLSGQGPASAIGRHLLELELGWPLDELRHALRACLSGERRTREVPLDAVGPQGRRCKLRVSPLLDSGGETRGAIVLMDLADDDRP